MGRPASMGPRVAESAPCVGGTVASGSESFYRALVENAGDILTILDRGGVITYQSPAIRKALDVREDELIGRHIADLVHPDDRERLLRKIEECVRMPGAGLGQRRPVQHGQRGTPLEQHVGRAWLQGRP